MNAQQWINQTTGQFENAGIASARLDALILLEDATNKDRGWLLAHPEYEISEVSLSKLKEQIKRRSNHEPLAYIRGRSEFYGREFLVTPATLQPRPETETMIDLFRFLDLPDDSHAVDVGTGSGAIAITIKLECPNLRISATEINQNALIVAEHNSKTFRTDINWFNCNLIEKVNSPIDAVLANLPYVPNGQTINKAAMQEPRIAIFGGEDGLDIYRGLFEQILSIKQKPKYVLTESLPFQHDELKRIAHTAGYTENCRDDFIQVFALN